jgi:exo-beta-1,3-glucanase (GH17 family)
VPITDTVLVTPTPPPAVASPLDGFDFGPYIAKGQDPNRGTQLTEAEAARLVARVAPYTRSIRTYGCGGGLEHAGRLAHGHGLKAVVGAWLGRDPAANEAQLTCLIGQARAGHVDVTVVGSETLYRGDLTEAQLLASVARVKQAVPPGIQVSTTDVYGQWLARPQLVNAVDSVYVNIFPYWEGIRADRALAALDARYRQVVAAAGGKRVTVSESGWPDCGQTIGEAVPSPANPSAYVLSFVSWARSTGTPYLYFEAYPEPYKAAYEGPQGACWGVLDPTTGRPLPGRQGVFDGQMVPDNWTPPTATPAAALRAQQIPLAPAAVGSAVRAR